MSALRSLAALAERPALTAVGLMSGTSADGIDAVVARLDLEPGRLGATVLGGLTVPFDEGLRARVLRARSADAEEIAHLHALLGARFADAALVAIEDAGLRCEDVDVVGSHGQTVAHLPRKGDGAATLQIGCAARIAERTGLPVVADLRSRDTAAGGQGAPLVPRVDWLLLRPEKGARLALNLGGVANVTLVTQDEAGVRAFDTGPANGPLDVASQMLLATPCDRDGAAAARGTPDEREVRRLLGDPWFATPPPRSLARATFGDHVVAELLARRPDLAADDVLATLTEYVARSVAAACRDHLGVTGERPGDVRDMIVSGGGVRNVTLMARLRSLLAPLPVRSSAELGLDPDLREALAFAVLAVLAVRGEPGNLPAVTGARGPRVLGAFHLP